MNVLNLKRHVTEYCLRKDHGYRSFLLCTLRRLKASVAILSFLLNVQYTSVLDTLMVYFNTIYCFTHA